MPDPASAPTQAPQALQTARSALQAGRWSDAANLYQKLLAAHPGQAEATHGWGLAMCQLGQPALGIAMMQRALAAEADNPHFLFTLSHVLARSDRSQAFMLLGRAAGLAPEDAAIALAFAQALRERGQPREALAVIARLVAGAGAGNQAARRAQVELHFELDDLDAMGDSLRRLLAQWPELASDYRLGHARPASGLAYNGPAPGSLTARPASSHAQPSGCMQHPLPDDLAAAAPFAVEMNLGVFDGFVEDFAAHRRDALARRYHAVAYAEQNFPGVQTDGQHCDALMQRIATLMGRTIKWNSPDNGACRLSYADSSARADIHIDQPATESTRHHAGVLYLNEPAQCRGGTSFWRHQATGWSCRPTLAALKAQGFGSSADFQRRCLKTTQKLPFEALKAGRAGWELLFEVPMRANRLVLYRSDFFHSISDVFGSTPEDGRLVQLFFFETVP